MSDTATPALDAAELPLSDYRALREGRSIERAPVTTRESSEAPPAKTPPANAESGAESEPAKESSEGPEDENGSEGEQEQQQGEKKPGQKRGLVDEVIKLRRENRELKTRVTPPPQDQQQPKPAPPVEVAPPADDPEPDIKKYSDYDKYNRDLVKWEVRNTQRQAAAEAQQRAEQEAARSRVSTWQQRVSSAAAEFSDFEAVAFNTTLPISRTMGDAIMRSDVGPQVLYHLGSHPDVAGRIAKLDPIDQIREIGKLEISLSKPVETPPSDEDEEDSAPPTKQATSKAPAPIPRPAGSGAKPAPSLKSLEGISQAEYRALRESGKLR